MLGLGLLALMIGPAYTGTYEQAELKPHGLECRTGTRYLDAFDRMRDESTITFQNGKVERVTFLQDPAKRVMVFVDSGSGRVLARMTVPVGGIAAGAGPGRTPAEALPPPPRVARENLGKRVIAGIPCFGERRRLDDDVVVELWRAEEFPGLRLSHTVTRGGVVEFQFEMTKLDLGPPDPALFAELD